MTEDGVALISKARESAGAARLLLERYPAFAASRAYYAMFYVAEAFLLEEGLSFSSHGAVIGAFGKHFAKAKKLPAEFHRYLIDGQDWRIKSDYDPHPDTSRDDAAEMIEQAEAFIALAEQHLGSQKA